MQMLYTVLKRTVSKSQADMVSYRILFCLKHSLLSCLCLAPFHGGSAGRNIVQYGSNEGPCLHEQGCVSDEHIRRGNHQIVCESFKLQGNCQKYDTVLMISS